MTIAFSIQCKYKCVFFFVSGKQIKVVTLKSICEQLAFKIRARLCFCKRVYYFHVQETSCELLGQMVLLRGEKHPPMQIQFNQLLNTYLQLPH